jgi:hypothetical protein
MYVLKNDLSLFLSISPTSADSSMAGREHATPPPRTHCCQFDPRTAHRDRWEGGPGWARTQLAEWNGNIAQINTKFPSLPFWRLHHDIDGQQAICCHPLALSRVAASILAPWTIMRHEKIV